MPGLFIDVKVAAGVATNAEPAQKRVEVCTASNEIASRKGKMINGTFVKQTL